MTVAVINGSECYIPFTCVDTSGNPFTPTSISYQVWDTTNDIEVLTPTTFPAAQTGTITLAATVNTMNAASATLEQRTATVKIGIPGGTYQNLVATYALMRAPGTP